MNNNSDQGSIIKVIGVGGGGSNAVNHMFRCGIKDVEFVVCNTDQQALEDSPVPVKVALGAQLTEGRGAGNKPEQGRQSAIENIEELELLLSTNTKMVFITAGMGGGTGTGAAPVIAKAAHDLGVLTVGIVTIPFRFEGQRRLNQAIEGIRELNEHVDSLLVINNEKLREIYGDLTISDAFSQADNVLTTAAKGIAEIITVHGYVNVDFADVQTVMTESGVAIMGSAKAKGENRAMEAIREALTSPLLNNNNINGAKNILLNITSGKKEVTMSEIGRINDFVQECAGSNANIIWGNGNDESLDDFLSVTVIATGFNAEVIPELYVRKEEEKKVFSLGNRKVEKKRSNSGRKSVPGNQTTIEFDAQEKDVADQIIELEERMKNISQIKEPAFDRISQEVEPAVPVLRRKNSDLDELESVPAYKRKGIQVNDHEESRLNDHKDVSRYTLSDEGDHTISLHKNNYLDDKVD